MNMGHFLSFDKNLARSLLTYAVFCCCCAPSESTASIIILNINSYAGGSKLWVVNEVVVHPAVSDSLYLAMWGGGVLGVLLATGYGTVSMSLLEGSRIFLTCTDNAFRFCQNNGEILFRSGNPGRLVSPRVCNYPIWVMEASRGHRGSKSRRTMLWDRIMTLSIPYLFFD